MTGRTATRLAGSSPALRPNVFITVLPVDSKAINGRSTDYLDGRSVFLGINPDLIPHPHALTKVESGSGRDAASSAAGSGAGRRDRRCDAKPLP
jgi:hypothetical protein